jgi:hypothetical protein
VPSSEPPANIGNVSGFIRDLVESGQSATQALNTFRGAGGAIRDSRWYALYGQVTDAIAREPQFLAVNPYALPSPSEYGTWAMGSGGQYATTVEVQLLDRGTGLTVTQLYSHITNEPHTGIEAEQAAEDQFGQPEGEGDYGVTYMGAIAKAYYQTVPYGAQ